MISITSTGKSILMENKMAEEQAQAESQNPLGNREKPAGNQKKRKASWVRTILWMLSMMLLANVVVGIIAYFLFFYKNNTS
jgi:cell division septal protein FtsQ